MTNRVLALLVHARLWIALTIILAPFGVAIAAGPDIPSGFSRLDENNDPVVLAFKDNLHSLSDAHNATERELDLLRRTVDSYRDQVTVGLALIGILLGVVGVLLPILVYFTSILPATKVVDEARKTLSALDDRFLELTTRHQQTEIKNAIDRLSAPDSNIASGAALYLSANAHYPFDDKQIFDIAQVAQDADFGLKYQLLNILAGRESPVVLRILEDVISGPNPNMFLPHLLKHLMTPSGQPLRAKLIAWITAQANHIYLSSLLFQAASTSRIILRSLLDDRDLFDKFDIAERAVALSGLKGSPVVQNAGDLISRSRLGLEFSGTVRIPVQFSSGRFVSCEPQLADQVFVYENGIQKPGFGKGTPDFAKYIAELSAPAP